MSLIRSAALNIIKSLVPLGLPGSEIIGILRKANSTYRRTTMLSDIRKAQDFVKHEAQVTKLTSDAVVPDSWMSQDNLGQPYNYRVHVKVDYFDNNTNEYTTEHRFMFEDDNKSVGEFAEDFPDYASTKGAYEGIDIMNVQVVGVTKNMRAGEAPF